MVLASHGIYKKMLIDDVRQNLKLSRETRIWQSLVVEPDVEESRGFGHLCWDKHTRNVCKSCVCTWTLKGVRERDLFGAHAYERTNRLAAYHTEWTKLAKLQG
ncbi:hypothetical protein IGI04_027359 [Brassica rapa subsp. trilocularis]|uniref:Uncharacterized protein n=3 Tax=Brassica TaxID=3705 RepID=A0A3P6AXK2_BRACM|nr:hypothetical protein IGI04_027359 [Brassica rapa subsp. trilocularis]KAH0918666.1 hypothetical protein HID58_026326 [Brassica napus]CAF2167727.1 unnamed protein product [Brassica napus]CAG7902628.1 unnamed protein product [Brassica rapa]VDC98936.1 unnamed protein product [Brassica rapa]